jgi:hypothetical protein
VRLVALEGKDIVVAVARVVPEDKDANGAAIGEDAGDDAPIEEVGTGEE